MPGPFDPENFYNFLIELRRFQTGGDPTLPKDIIPKFFDDAGRIYDTARNYGEGRYWLDAIEDYVGSNTENGGSRYKPPTLNELFTQLPGGYVTPEELGKAKDLRDIPRLLEPLADTAWRGIPKLANLGKHLVDNAPDTVNAASELGYWIAQMQQMLHQQGLNNDPMMGPPVVRG